jgi:DNA helicase-2/ATP-dependent DNA helicase PcrA
LSGTTDQKEVLAALNTFTRDWREHDEREERRLAYVAVTRPRRLLLCSGYWWGEGVKRPRGPSVFLDEIRAACDEGAGVVDVWTPEPAPGSANPSAEVVASAEWPQDPLGVRRPAMAAAADLIRRMIAQPTPDAAQAFADLIEQEPEVAARAGLAAELIGIPESADPADPDLDRWRREADLLLAEREERARRDGPLEVALPGHLSVSQLVVLRRDPQALARSLRRPLPQRPTPHARRGTAFHAWLEQRFGSARLIDVDELPGAADDGAAGDEELAALQEAFLTGEWADRNPVEVEVPFATTIAGVVVRGRMDAVFSEPGHRFDVIDWKTGRRPSGAEAEAAAVQLAAYRIAWAALAGVPVNRVRAGFHYVREQVTVRPVDLLDAEQLAEMVEQIPSR